MNFSSITTLFKKGHKGKGFRLGENPSLDWLIALGVFFLLTALGVFLTVTNHPSVSESMDSETSEPKIFSQEVLDRVLTKYEDRQKQFDSLLDSPSALVDPSQ